MSGTLNHEINGALALLWITLAGCGVTTLLDRPRMDDVREVTPEVSHILVIWHPSTKDSPDAITEGFHGTLMFFRGDNPLSQKVANPAVVMLFNSIQKNDWTLHRQYQFTPSAWKSHERTTAIGTVYNIFVPGSVAPDSHLGIRIQHTSKSGKTTFSDLAEVAGDPGQELRTHE